MPSCLGIYVDKNLIKYAKLRTNKDSFELENLDVEVFDNLELALKNIISKTNSEKTPISINIQNELYNYFEVFSELDKKDIAKSLDIEFEILCQDKKYDKKSLLSKYILINDKDDLEKYKALYISANKNDIFNRVKALSNYKLSTMSTVSTSITNLGDFRQNENVAIINMENETQITTIINKQIDRVDILNAGLGNVIENVQKLELSWKNAYDVCKNTILEDSDSEYIDLLLPTIRRIINESRRVIESFNEKIYTIYLTGMGATISNIDLYFQNEFQDIKCEILKPFFMNLDSMENEGKEYIEVNSAIALALDGLGFINKNLNFIPSSKLNNIENIINFKEKFNIKNLKKEIKKPLDIKEKLILRSIVACLIVIIGYTGASKYVTKQNNIKIEEAKVKLEETNKQIGKMDEDLSEIESYTNAYNLLIGSVDSLSTATTDSKNSRKISKDAIPNLLNKIMNIIPKQVQLISIENTEENHIVIEAVSEKYEQLGYFLTAIKLNSVLDNISSTPGVKSDSLVQITIEGDLK